MKTQFWSSSAIELLRRNGRQDIIDRGNDLAERVTALILTANNRLDQYIKKGNLYNNQGGLSSLHSSEPVVELEDFVNNRLRQEINALEHLLQVFDEIDYSVVTHG